MQFLVQIEPNVIKSLNSEGVPIHIRSIDPAMPDPYVSALYLRYEESKTAKTKA
jgi:hypothetical protein